MQIRSIFTKKRIIWGIIILIVALIGYQIFRPKDNSGSVITENAKVQDLKATVLATGQVTSTTDLSLSFKSSGVVRRVSVKVGDAVKENQLLANLDQRDQLAALTSARGALNAAQANYQKILDGSSNEEIQVAQAAVDAATVTLNNTKQQQDLAVTNAQRTLFSSGLEAVTTNTQSTGTITVSGLYSGTAEGSYTLSLYGTGAGTYYSAKGLGDVSGPLIYGSPLPIGNGLYVTFSTTGSFIIGSIWEIKVPNTQSTSYITNYNSYQSALTNRTAAVASAQASLDSAVAQLNLKKAQARPADLQAAQAQVLSAQGQVLSAQASLEATEIRAPAAGTATQVNVKVGELAGALSPVIIVQDVGNLYLEANISEANISDIKLGQEVEVTFDALGTEKKYTATVSNVDPASTVISGVVNYKIKALIDAVEEVKPGMTANMSVLTGTKAMALAVPSRAIVSRDGKKFIRVITDTKKKLYQETEVTTGFEGDGGLVEIISGITANQEIVTFIDTK